MSALPEPAGTIYDIGYRHYEGPRLGRRGATGAIVGAGLRAVFGMGRSARSKIIPWGAVILALLPAGVALAIKVLAGDLIELYSYDSYLWNIGGLLPIFVAAQAPELVVNDMRHHVLPLYFSRPIRRTDYVAAKVTALSIGLLALTLLPLLVLFVGRVLAAEDVLGAIGDEADALPMILASLGLAICCLANRRAYAAGAVLAVFLVGSVASQIFADVGANFGDIAPFLSPLSILDGTRQWLFGGPIAESPVSTSSAPLYLYGLATIALLVISWGILAIRYRRITA